MYGILVEVNARKKLYVYSSPHGVGCWCHLAEAGGVAMANEPYVEMLTRGDVRIWNQWRKEKPGVRPYLGGADLVGANLTGADLHQADFTLANLTRADLSRANLAHANLQHANLQHANLQHANLTGANLTEAFVADVNLTGTNLTGADLTGAYLNDAIIREADLTGADLTGACPLGAYLTFTNLTGANLTRTLLGSAYLFRVNLTGADLTGASLTEAVCIETKFTGATLIGCDVYGISTRDVDLSDAKQADLRIRPWHTMAQFTVDNLEVAQFLNFLLSNQKPRNMLDTITSKVVLILGRFSDGRKPILDAIREVLRNHPNGYIPVLMDFDPQRDKPALEKVQVLSRLARFIIADLADPHMVRSELTYITANVPTVPVQPILQLDANLPPEYGTWNEFKSFLPVYRYVDLPHLLANLTEAVITPVESM
jgi:uncharacterized protein YjbI with pentapeptide repeats